MRKGEVALLRRPTFEPLFTTHPSEVGSTSPWTLLAAVLRGRSLTRLVAKPLLFVGLERDSRLIGFVILFSLSILQQICHVIPRLTLATHPIHAQNFTIWSHSTAQVPRSCLASTM